MYFWLKLLHIAAMAVWFTGLFLLPRLLVPARMAGKPAPDAALGHTLYFNVMTPAAVATILPGILLLARGFEGAWLPVKLALVSIAVLLHVFYGKLLMEPGRGRGTAPWLGWLAWLPLLLLLLIAALAAAKPVTLAVALTWRATPTVKATAAQSLMSGAHAFADQASCPSPASWGCE